MPVIYRWWLLRAAGVASMFVAAWLVPTYQAIAAVGFVIVLAALAGRDTCCVVVGVAGESCALEVTSGPPLPFVAGVLRTAEELSKRRC